MRVPSGIGMVYGAAPGESSSRTMVNVSPFNRCRPPPSAYPRKFAPRSRTCTRAGRRRSTGTDAAIAVVSRMSRFAATVRGRVPPSRRQFSNAISYAVRWSENPSACVSSTTRPCSSTHARTAVGPSVAMRHARTVSCRATVHRLRPSSNRALSGTANDDSASTRTVSGVGASATGSKLGRVYVLPTSGSSASAIAIGTMVGRTTGADSETCCVSAALLSCAITMRSDESPTDRPLTAMGAPSDSNESVNSSSDSLRDSRTSEFAVARWSRPPIGRSAAR